MDSDVFSSFFVRPSQDEDVPAIQRIYAHHVLSGTASFDYDPPSVHSMREKHQGVLGRGFPYLVAENTRGDVVGYTYADFFRPRPAYRFTVENSVYLHPEWTRRGIGKMLLEALILRCEEKGYRQMIAVIGGLDNVASVALHRSVGFSHVATLPGAGFKFGRWIEAILMQRGLGDADHSVPMGNPA